MADDLIGLARQLARFELGRPKAISLRRAVSSAYYAVFHALSYLCADTLIGWREPYKVFTPVYRALDHRKSRTILDGMRQQGLRGGAAETVALVFAELQDARHDADYNPEPFRLNRNSTLDLIDSAERAIALINAFPSDEKLALAVKLVVKSR